MFHVSKKSKSQNPSITQALVKSTVILSKKVVEMKYKEAENGNTQVKYKYLS